MAHVFEASGTQFIYNGDYSGDVEISNLNGDHIKIPFEDMKEFLVEYIRSLQIAALESASTDEILKG